MGKIVWFIGILFTLVGLGMLVIGGWTLGTTLKYRRDGQTAEGSVVDFETSESTSTSNGRRTTKTMYAPVFEFRDPSGSTQRIVSSSSSSSRGYDIGEKVPVRFLPSKPGDARIDSFMGNWFAPLITGGLGTLFFGIGIGAIVSAITKARNRKWLKKNGMRVQARYTGTIYDESLKVNNKSPWRLTAQWQHPVTGDMHSFQSDAIWYDPSQIVQQETVDVLVNADNPKVYEIDIGFLPKSA